MRVIGEIDRNNPLAESTVKCPACGEEQTLMAKVFSVTQDPDEMIRVPE